MRISQWLWYGSMIEGSWAAKGFTSHMRRAYRCKKCGKEFMYNVHEVKDHDDGCTGQDPSDPMPPQEAQPAEDSVPKPRKLQQVQPFLDEGNVALSAQDMPSTPTPPTACLPRVHDKKRSAYECAVCDKTYFFTGQQAADHAATHGHT